MQLLVGKHDFGLCCLRGADLGLRIHSWWPTVVSACFCFSHFASFSEFSRGILQEMPAGHQKLVHASDTDSE